MFKIKLQGLDKTKPKMAAVWTNWLNDCQNETTACVAANANGHTYDIKDSVYRRNTIKKHYFFDRDMGPPFYGKCAYCEATVVGKQHGDVEHFRPKARVTDEHDNIIHLKDANGTTLLDIKGKPIPHPGYYWLAYDLHNLLPSCQICNQASDFGGKRNRFPVTTEHATMAAEVSDEKPLLINPASGDDADNPAKHLKIDFKTGVMLPKTTRGKMCIDVFDLNERQSLLDDRRNVRRIVWSLLAEIDTKPQDVDQLQMELKDILQGKKAYTMAARAVFEAYTAQN